MKLIILAMTTLVLGAAANASVAEHGASPYNINWTTPSKVAAGSMPLGNGEVGINLWVEQNGDLLFYISRSDSYSVIYTNGIHR